MPIDPLRPALTLPWLLVATPQLTDPNFRKTVVLVVEHGASGSLGFILNRPLTTPVADIVRHSPLPIPSNVPAWFGGPVETAKGVILHRQDAGNDPLVAGLRSTVAISATEATLRALIDDARERSRELEALGIARPDLAAGTCLYPYRFVVGYSGWGASQLDGELRAGAWIQVPASDALVFGSPWGKLWELALETVGVAPKTLVTPAQAYLN